MKKVMLIAITLLLALPSVSQAAEMWQYLYVNRDGKSWQIENAFSTPEDCNRAAKEAVATKRVQGAGCAADTATTREEDAASKAAAQRAYRQQQEQAARDRDAARDLLLGPGWRERQPGLLQEAYDSLKQKSQRERFMTPYNK
jgi:hypothetical protein